ncbi:MAG TPA: dTDP-4-dehydrorhamnose 3,5-epimerase family protein [Mycobacteriales bacterium]|nr:dTDP-4-dehydrorhamnose 3,5-epimerase family protein [Mycobacteriales bacterium]
MKIEPLSISGIWMCTPQVHPDDRGAFLEWFRGDRLEEATGRRFQVAQANHSVSQRGVVRGVHFADVPPGQAKYVYCPDGAVIDVIVDLRVGSPTFGASEAVLLDDTNRRGLFIAEGLGHAFCSLRDDTSLSYLVSTVYRPASEHAVNPFDPALALPWNDHVDTPIASPRDLEAPTFAEAERDGLLPNFADCVDL